MNEWQVSKPLEQCSGTGNRIETGQEYFAALVETNEGLQRRDFCADYWLQDKPDVFCYWKTRLPDAGQKKHLLVDDQMLMAFFDRLTEETEREKTNFRFVLALILMRKRRLKYDCSKRQDGQDIWVLKVTGEQRLVEIIDPGLDAEQIQQQNQQPKCQIGQVIGK